MRFAISLTTSALVLASAIVGEETIYPPGGAGVIRVNLAGESEFTGCLNADGKWTVTENCAQIFGNGQGGISSDKGWLILDDDSTITTTSGTWSVAWVGTHDGDNRDTKQLIGNIGIDNDDVPHGGPTWYAAAIAAQDETVQVSGAKTEDAQEIYLTFISTFEE
ncbi:uncharacterized protein LDX57_012128 [Aspergillus melleus]|uniref:uncharacterized protein n=1 Tax=Aspergillus melleus TaxID=138277 RepID=UPI001E8D39B0|nr:uncharacterized protein LDX57_012128 [Aspergillus melleus]KAH8434483.1 hypothetical protein LDX57_012128 [Aspergillus melleus]